MSGRRTSVDAALLHLVRIVLDDEWTLPTAARRLVQLVDGDLHVLRRVRARVLRAGTDRSTGLTDRAIATLDAALPDVVTA